MASTAAGTPTPTSRSALTLTRSRVQAKRIYLVATWCRTCGTVGVDWNGTLIKKLNLYASTTKGRRAGHQDLHRRSA